MYVYDENKFNIFDFLTTLKKIELSILNDRINDIISYQNWHDKALSKGTNYYTNYEELKYYKLQDHEDITYESIFNRFIEIYEWFLDDEDYENLVSKLLNVILGYDTYKEVVNYKEYLDKKILITVNNQKLVKKEDKKLYINKPISKKEIKKIEISPTNVNHTVEDLKNDLLKSIDQCDFDKSNDILKKIFYIKSDQNINVNNEFTIKSQDDNNFLKNQLISDIKVEITKILKSSYKNNSKNIINNNPVNLCKNDFFTKYIENLSKKCIKCNQLKLKCNFEQDNFKRDGYNNFCKNCIKL